MVLTALHFPDDVTKVILKLFGTTQRPAQNYRFHMARPALNRMKPDIGG